MAVKEKPIIITTWAIRERFGTRDVNQNRQTKQVRVVPGQSLSSLIRHWLSIIRIVLDGGLDGDIEVAKGENGQFLTRDDKQLNIMYLKLIKSDIHRIGGATYHNDDGNCVFVFYGDDDAYGIERIFLRTSWSYLESSLRWFR